ncbi:MAG: regulatory protein RecX [SAR202 cluster bacterium]|jgi:regulatory protein|nr:regulatory protein RecX [SAR202 cluster bacterium]
MNDTEPHQRATAAALRFLSHRPRSKEEVRTRLRRSFPADVVDQVIDDLTERSLVDDSSFAKLWRDSRDSFNPRSATAIKRELISKGVAGDLAQRTVDDLDDMDSAYRAGLKHARRLERADLSTYRRRLWGYLQRRGFSSSVTRQTIARLLDERRGGGRSASCEDEDH